MNLSFQNNFQKAAATFESNYNDCIKRLNEAGEIYKEQYLEIQKLKKKLQKVKSNSKVDEKKVAASSPIVVVSPFCLLLFSLSSVE